MDILTLAIGLGVIAGGVFAAAFGYSLFRFVLAVLGFMVGFSVASTLTASLDTTLGLFISLAAGLILAGLGFALVRIGQYIAGALFGIVVSLLVLSLVNIQSDNILSLVGLAAGLGIGAFAGRFFGDMIILSATSFVGAYGIMLGLFTAFPDLLTDKMVGGRIPVNLPILVLMIAIALVGGLGQWNLYRRLRRPGMR